MAWYDPSKRIPVIRNTFIRIIEGFVFLCPASIRHEKKDKTNTEKKIVFYQDVSKRKCSFRCRGIDSHLLTTVLAQIKKPLVAQQTYSVLKNDEDVPDAVNRIIALASLSDPYYDIMVYQHRSDMSDTEAIYYYIRNSFAHGSFEIKKCQGERCYLLQSDKDEKVKAQMRLKESTLKRLLVLAQMSAPDIRAQQRKRMV